MEKTLQGTKSLWGGKFPKNERVRSSKCYKGLQIGGKKKDWW